MFSTLSENQIRAEQIKEVQMALNENSNAMKLTPFYTAVTRQDLVDSLNAFTDDIVKATDRLKSVAKVEMSVPMELVIKRADAIVVDFLAAPDEEKVRGVFDKARADVCTTLYGLRSHAMKTAKIPAEMAADAMEQLQEMAVVTRAVSRFYTSVPSDAAADFIFK